MPKRRFELREGSSDKFWEIEVRGETVTVRFGRTGSAGQEKAKDHGSPDVAAAAAEKLVREKTGKGYREVGPPRASSANLGDLLRELEDWLGAHRRDVLDSLGSPATPAELEKLLAGLRTNGYPADIALAPDLVTLLSWRTTRTTQYVPGSDGFFLGRNFMSIDWMIEMHGIMFGHARDNEEDPAHYHPGWVGFLDNGYSLLCVDAAGTFGCDPGNVVFVDFKGGESRNFEAPSLAAWFQLFLELLRHPRARRAFTLDATTDEEEDDLQELVGELTTELVPRLSPGYPIHHTVHDVPDAATARRRSARERSQLLFLKLEKREGKKTLRWECDVDGTRVDERVIDVGRSGTSTSTQCATEEEAAALAQRLELAKRREGFGELG